MAYCLDFRERVVAAVQRDKLSARAAARRFDVNPGTLRAWIKKHREGDLRPGKPGPTGPSKLTEHDRQLLEQMVRDRPGITSREAAAKLGHRFSEGHIRRLWLQMGLSFKRR